MEKKLVLVFDSIRDPRDLAEVIHLGLAAGIRIELCGASLEPSHWKVINILDSWLPGYREEPKLKHVTIHADFILRMKELKKQGYTIIGTTPFAKKNLFKFNLSQGKHAIIFGTETSGLSKEKTALMDEMLCVPMKNNTKFFTIRAIAPVFAFEALRQKKLV